jgi:HEAT repeat protein
MSPRIALPAAAVAVCILVFLFASGTFRRTLGGPVGIKAPASGAPAASAASANAAADASAGPNLNSSGSATAVATALPVQNFSDQDLQAINSLPPQDQAERLLMAAVNHYDGAAKMVMDRVDSWHGKLSKTANWDTVEQAARSSSDLRARNAAIEADLAVYGLEKNSASVDKLISDAPVHVGNRGFDFYMLGMLGNRGVESSRVHTTLKEWAHDADEGTRYWAIEGLAFLGSDDTISDFLDVLRSDPSMNVRQRCAASLTKSGTMTREQRMQAVPGLIEIAADGSAGAATQGWAFQALREITYEQIGNDAAAWRTWFADHGSERLEQFRRADSNIVLGNS